MTIIIVIIIVIIHLLLTDPPEVLNDLPSITVNESDTVTLDCLISGNPLPDILWLKKDNERLINITSTTDDRITMDTMQCLHYENCYQSILSITNVNKTDEGEYVCQGMNSVPDIMGNIINSSSANITVQGIVLCFLYLNLYI